MEKNNAQLGKILVTVAFMLVLASITFFDTAILVILVALFVIAYLRKEDQDNLLSLLEAVYVTLAFQIIRLIEYAVESSIKQIIVWAGGNAYGVVNDIFTVLRFLITAGFAFIVIIALINALGKKPTKTLIVHNLALKSFGLFVPKQVDYYQQQPYDVAANQQYAPPQQTEHTENQHAVQETGEWTCACGRTNTGRFCASCGKPKS